MDHRWLQVFMTHSTCRFPVEKLKWFQHSIGEDVFNKKSNDDIISNIDLKTQTLKQEIHVGMLVHVLRSPNSSAQQHKPQILW